MQNRPWPEKPADAIALQRELAPRVEREPGLGTVATVGGVDASYRRGAARAAVVTLSYPGLEPLEGATARRPVDSPYVPGLLSFREGPAVLEALEKLRRQPDLLIFDAQGLAHPRRFGLASHVGVVADIPSIGCAKSRLCGEHDEPGEEKGSVADLVDAGEVIGAVVRTRTRVNPVFVSIGHRVDLETAIAYVLGCCKGYRSPEPVRWADRVAGGQSLPVSSQSATP